MRLNRRTFGTRLAAAAGALSTSRRQAAADREEIGGFRLKYIVGSCMYGYTDVRDIFPEVQRCGASAVDLWPRVHGSQREQVDTLGEDTFLSLAADAGVQVGCITQYALGPFRLQEEMRLARRLGCSLIVTGGRGPRGQEGDALRSAVQRFVDQMKPHLDVAEETGVTIAIENHGHGLFETADSLKWLVELCDHPHLGIALAPYHLPQDTVLLSDLIRTVGSRIAMFYAWQHGHGCMEKLPKEEELLQLPGRGPLDFRPLLQALKDIDYQGWTEIFMHPVPRGVPIRETTSQVTEEINRSRRYLSTCLQELD